MAGQIKHSWNGTVLTIESDSGISSADLKGAKGDTGIRGAQGRAGEGAFTYDDFTPEQLAALKGEKGEDGDILLLSTAKGKAISINDSSNSNIIGLNMSGAAENPVISVYGKNLITFPYESDSITINGVTITNNADGGILLQGTATANVIRTLTTGLDLGESSINAIEKESATGNGFVISKRLYYGASGKAVTLQIKAGTTVNETIYPQAEKGETLTAYELCERKQTVALPYTFAEGDFLTLENGRVNIVAGDITDTETGQAILALHTNKPNTTIISDMDCSVVYKADVTTAFNNLNARVAALEGGKS